MFIHIVAMVIKYMHIDRLPDLRSLCKEILHIISYISTFKVIVLITLIDLYTHTTHTRARTHTHTHTHTNAHTQVFYIII